MSSYEFFILGLVAGLAIGFAIIFLRRNDARRIVNETMSQSQSQMSNVFGSIALDALNKASNNFTQIAKETLSTQTKEGLTQLEGKKTLIDQSLENINKELDNVKNLMNDLEKDRSMKFGELTTAIKTANEQTQKLQETTETLNTALSNSRVRGQWGERMADDILRMIGFVEGVNYLKQKSIESTGSRPDFTFMLPNELKLNMDVKFPFDNFINYLNCETDGDKELYKNKFVQDVKQKVKQITTREYINVEENTLDFALLFIPNQHVYEFINETDSTVFEFALKEKIVLTSPMTLYSMLVIIRQSTDNFNLQKNVNEVLKVMGDFNKQWDSFIKSFNKMGEKIQDVGEEFQNLTSVRKKKLDVQLKKIEDLRKNKGIPLNPSLENEEIEGSNEAEGD